MPDWTLYYDDGSTFTSDDGTPEAAPLDGVLAIVEERDGAKKIYWPPYRGVDYYFWTGDSWAAGNLADLERWLRRDMPRLKYGRWTTAEKWNALWRKLKHG